MRSAFRENLGERIAARLGRLAGGVVSVTFGLFAALGITTTIILFPVVLEGFGGILETLKYSPCRYPDGGGLEIMSPSAVQ